MSNIEQTKYCKQVSLKEAVANGDCVIYTDQVGYITARQPVIGDYVYTSENDSIRASKVYTKSGKGSSAQYQCITEMSASQIANIFKCKLYVNRSYRNSYYTYEPTENDEQLIEIVAVDVKLPLGEMKLTKDNLKEYNERLAQLVWKMNDSEYRPDRIDNYALLTVGDLICYNEKGTYKITERCLPNSGADVMLKAMSLVNGSELSINWSGEDISNRYSDFYPVPYWEYKDEISTLNDMVNELLLSPYLENNHGTFNLYWLPVENAAQYIVTVYRYVEVNRNYKKLYELQKIVIDRNTRYFVVDKLLESPYIFRVTAEDREGNVIAQSRGIRQDYHVPQIWRKN